MPAISTAARRVSSRRSPTAGSRRVGAAEPTDPTDPAHDARDPALVLLLDGYDRLKTLDHWFRTAFLPSLRSDSVVVLVGREPPGAAWRTDPGWRAVATVCRLDPLTDEESLDLLARCAVPDDGRPRLTRLGGGHPMTLALLADSATTAQLPGRPGGCPRPGGGPGHPSGG